MEITGYPTSTEMQTSMTESANEHYALLMTHSAFTNISTETKEELQSYTVC